MEAERDRVALAVWQMRLSPVFDVSRQLLLLSLVDGQVQQREWADIEEEALAARARQLAQRKVRLLICGAISRPLLSMIEARGIQVRPFLTGEVEEIIEALLAGRLDAPRYRMPGTCGRRRRRSRQRLCRARSRNQLDE